MNGVASGAFDYDQRLSSVSKSRSTFWIAAVRSPPVLRIASVMSRSRAPGSKTAVRRCPSSSARLPGDCRARSPRPEDLRRAREDSRSRMAFSRALPEADRAGPRERRPRTHPVSTSAQATRTIQIASGVFKAASGHRDRALSIESGCAKVSAIPSRTSLRCRRRRRNEELPP